MENPGDKFFENLGTHMHVHVPCEIVLFSANSLKHYFILTWKFLGIYTRILWNAPWCHEFLIHVKCSSKESNS